MNYICFMFQTAIVSAGLFFSRKLIYTLYNSKTAAFFTSFLHIPVTKPDFRYLRSNRNT